jgi:hypothetical protein
MCYRSSLTKTLTRIWEISDMREYEYPDKSIYMFHHKYNIPTYILSDTTQLQTNGDLVCMSKLKYGHISILTTKSTIYLLRCTFADVFEIYVRTTVDNFESDAIPAVFGTNYQ